MSAQVTVASRRAATNALAPLLLGALVALALGTYGRLHQPGGGTLFALGFSNPLAMKAYLTSVAAGFGLVQLVSALRMYGRLGGGRNPAWLPEVHRWSGTAAFALSVPVAVHCLYGLGFGTYDARVAVHSTLGCLFYGAFAAKMLTLRRHAAPGWLLPVLGALLLTALAGLWAGAALWYFNQG